MPATRVRRVCRRCRVYVRGVLHRLYTAAALLWCTSTRLVYGYMSLACVAVGSEAVDQCRPPAVSGCVCPYTLCARGACGAACCVMCSVHCVRTDGARYIFNQTKRGKTNTPVGGSAPWVSPSASILPRHRTDGSPPRALRSRHGHAKATVMQCESPHAGALHRSAASVPGQPSQRPVHSLLHSGTGRARVERSVGSVGRVGR